jgi:hypothetical protein
MYSPLQQSTGQLTVNPTFTGGFSGSAGSATSSSATSSSATSGGATSSSTMNCTFSGACFVGGATSGSVASGNPAFSLRYVFEGLVAGVPRWNVTVWIQGSPQQLSQIKYVIYHSITSPYNPTSKSYDFSAGKRTDLKPMTSRENNFLLQKTVSVGRFPLTATLYFKNGTNTEIGPIHFSFYKR